MVALYQPLKRLIRCRTHDSTPLKRGANESDWRFAQ
jgi:hypothetical protein